MKPAEINITLGTEIFKDITTLAWIQKYIALGSGTPNY